VLLNKSFSDFSVILSRFSLLFAGIVSNFVYYPRKKKRKAAKRTQKLAEVFIEQHPLRICFIFNFKKGSSASSQP
jgi:hypothetical protein